MKLRYMSKARYATKGLSSLYRRASQPRARLPETDSGSSRRERSGSAGRWRFQTPYLKLIQGIGCCLAGQYSVAAGSLRAVVQVFRVIEPTMRPRLVSQGLPCPSFAYYCCKQARVLG